MYPQGWKALIASFVLTSGTFAYFDTSFQPAFGSDLNSRQACIDNDVLHLFRQSTLESVPYCSSLLGIQDHTHTIDVATSKTYGCTRRGRFERHADTVYSLFSAAGNVTYASTQQDIAIVTIKQRVPCSGDATRTIGNADELTKGALVGILSDATTNAAIASEINSACSCLNIQPKTVIATATAPEVSFDYMSAKFKTTLLTSCRRVPPYSLAVRPNRRLLRERQVPFRQEVIPQPLGRPCLSSFKRRQIHLRGIILRSHQLRL